MINCRPVSSYDISIHASEKEATKVFDSVVVDSFISIHASEKEAT